MRRSLVFAALIAGFLVVFTTGTGLAADSVLVGDASIEGFSDDNAAGLAYAFSYTASASGTAQSVAVYVDGGSSASGLDVGLYADNGGHPGSLLASGSEGAVVVGQWNRMRLDANPVLSSGTTYWLSVLGTGGQLNIRDLDVGAGGCSETDSDDNLTNLPANWSTGANWPTCSLSAFVTGTESSTTTSAPASTVIPTTSGQALEGQTLTASTGSWSGNPTSYSYQWQTCDASGNNCAAVNGATSASLTLDSVDLGNTMRVVVTASNSGGFTSATSAATAVVSAPTVAPPADTVLPVVSGTTTQGQMLSTTNGSWTGSPGAYVYQWQACDTSGANCANVTGATSSSYLLASSNVAHTMRVVVTATNAGGSTAATSGATAVVGGLGGTVLLPHDPSFVGPSYYARFADGPSSSMAHFPICTYQVNLGQWSQLASRISGMGVNCIDDAYGAPATADYLIGAASGLNFNINGNGTDPSVFSHAMQDEPNSQGSQYAASSCSPTDDTCGQKYVNDANAYRSTDPTRTVWGNFSKDLMEWAYPPSGWTTAQFTAHNSEMLGALDIASSDNYGWTDNWEWNQTAGATDNDHFGAWIYGHAISRINGYNPNIPAYGFVECCDSGDGSGTTKPVNEMMPGMLQAAVWNILVHGGRGWTYWTTNFWDSSSGGDPYANPYSGATYQGSYALYGEHQWDPQYAAAQSVDQTVTADAIDLNSPTVSGISASSSSGVPVAALGKDVAGKLWLLAQADGNTTYPLSNQSTMTATITVPSAVPAGTVLNVVGENRTVTVNASHQITDTFSTTTETTFNGTAITYGYQHHIYSMP